MHSKLDEFANICYEQKLQKPQVTHEQNTAVHENNQESVCNSQGKRLEECPRLVGSAQPTECPQAASQKTKQTIYEILQEESDVTLQQYERERRGVDPEKVQQVLSKCEQAWRDCDGPGAKPVTTATQLAAECGREPPGSISIGDMHLQEVDSARKKASHELLSRLDGAIEAMKVDGGGTPSKSDDSMAQHLHDMSQNNSSGQKDNPGVSDTDECVSRFLLNINVPIRDLETSGMDEVHVSKIIERESSNYSHKSICGFVQEQRQIANGASSMHRGGSMGSTEYPLGGVTKDMIPEGVDSGLWNLMDSVGNPTLEGNNVTCANSKTLDTAGSQVERVSSSRSIAHIPSITAERNYSFGSSVTHPDCRGMRYGDADFCRPVSLSLWEADAATGLCSHVVAADQSSVSKRGIVRESTCQNLWWTADGFKSEKWSKGNMINKEVQALRVCTIKQHTSGCVCI
ncbi:hypothetical protein PR048_001930 [Dryococelus australis]|uniref:Uncharacterized protein n=1 Tax=Dryococelus australis TaxID=614101 RepID=A0ABQ9IJU0_9NEOP|nr:hypothetical protein PR048_001930 [Dryococelus australis]